MKINKVLVVISHPDDEVLGCGGFVKKLMDEGKEVKIIYINDGCTFRENHDSDGLLLQITQVNKVLGEPRYIVYGYKTAHFEDTPQNEFNDLVRREIMEFQPDTVLTHDENDLHKDHRIVHEAVMVACRFKEGSPVKNILTFAVISSSDISPKWAFLPNFYVDITDQIETKIEAMKCYETEYNEMVKWRGEDGIKTWGSFFGLQSNMKYAEVYKIIRASY